MNISQRKLMSSYNRAHASDHRRAADDETWAETRAVLVACALLFAMAVLSAFGIL